MAMQKSIQAIYIESTVYMQNRVNWPASLLVHFFDCRLFRIVIFHAHQFTQHARIFWPAGELCRVLLSFFIVRALVFAIARRVIVLIVRRFLF